MATPTRFLFLGDHGEEHCGCEAVSEVIRKIVCEKGVLVEPKDDFDILVVNGEGSMHHGRRNFLGKMHEIRLAQANGKQTYLVNTVWDTNPRGYDDCLKGLNDFWVRGVASSRDLSERHGLNVRHHIDLSYFADIDESSPCVDLGNGIAVTDVFSPQFGFVWLPRSATKRWTNVDMRKHSWSSFVRSLRTAKLLITGRHHGMYAACRARIPFIPIRGNSHKFEDLLETANSAIPVAENFSDVTSLINWAASNRKAYDELFDWMDRQPRWSFGENSAPDTMAYAIPPRRSMLQRANDAINRRSFGEASSLWQELLAEKGERLPNPRNACLAFFGNGDVELGMEVLSRTRLQKPSSIIFAKTLMQFARHPTIWLERGDLTGWWPLLKEAAYQARLGDLEAFHALGAQALAEVLDKHDPVMASSVSFFLTCKLVQLNLHMHAFDFRRRHPVDGTPNWVRDQEDVLLNALCRRFDKGALALLSEIQNVECWRDPSLRAVVVRHKTLFSGAPDSLVAEIHAHCKEFPQHAELRELRYSISGEAGQLDFVKTLLPKQKMAVEREALSHLPLAHYLVENGLSKTKELQARSRLFKEFQRGRDELIRTLSDSSLRIAVIGNSPIELGRGRGPIIDGYDVVIRFNDFVVTPPFDADYGTKTDILFQTYEITANSNLQIRQGDCLLVQRHAFHVFGPRDWTPVLQLAAAGQRLGYLPREAYILAAERLEATPSAGFAVASYLRQFRGTIDRADFFGFSFVDQLSGNQKAHYFGDERPSFIHNWGTEALEFEKLFSDSSR
jgi:hypothetical protein